MTDQELLRAHNRDKALKIKHEHDLEKALIPLFAYILRILLTNFKSGIAVNVSVFKPRLNAILLDQYKRIDGIVTLSSLDTKTHVFGVDTLASAIFLRRIIPMIAFRLEYILATTQKDIDKSIAEVQASKTPTSLEQLSKTFLDKTKYRKKLIAVTETQNAVELKKYLIAESYNTVTGVTLRKTWITTLDGRERPWHGDAFGQTVAWNKLFTVMDELLSYPGDISYGATPANICNCRCSLIYY